MTSIDIQNSPFFEQTHSNQKTYSFSDRPVLLSTRRVTQRRAIARVQIQTTEVSLLRAPLRKRSSQTDQFALDENVSFDIESHFQIESSNSYESIDRSDCLCRFQTDAVNRRHINHINHWKIINFN